MKNAYFIAYLKKLFIVVLNNLQLYGETGKPPQIHRIRVAIKNIRAVIAFLSESGQNIKIRSTYLDSLFDDAGKLRDLHVLMDLGNTYSKNSEFNKKLERKERRISLRFKRHIPKHIRHFTRLAYRIRIKGAFPDADKVKKYYRKKVKRIHNPFADAASTHHFRMILKELMYVYNALPAAGRRASCINIKYIDTLQNLLGKWHDRYAAVRFLKSGKRIHSYHLKKMEQSEGRLIKQIRNSYKEYSKGIFLT